MKTTKLDKVLARITLLYNSLNDSLFAGNYAACVSTSPELMKLFMNKEHGIWVENATLANGFAILSRDVHDMRPGVEKLLALRSYEEIVGALAEIAAKLNVSAYNSRQALHKKLRFARTMQAHFTKLGRLMIKDDAKIHKVSVPSPHAKKYA